MIKKTTYCIQRAPRKVWVITEYERSTYYTLSICPLCSIFGSQLRVVKGTSKNET